MIDLEKIKKTKSIPELLEFGIINIDKCSGPTSFNVSDFIRKELKLRKTSHFGTLDPKVTGVLPVSLNRACKLMGYFLGADKEYVGIMRLHEEHSLKELEEIISKKFLGKIKQTPPVKSRVKRQEREREIKKFDLLEKTNKDILFRVVCEGGTYIRKLIDDLGKELGSGAHMLELRRTRAGLFDEKTLVNLYDFEKAVEEYKKGNEEALRKIIFPAEIVSRIVPVVQISNKNLKQILTGKKITKEDLISKKKIEHEVVSVFCGERFVGIYRKIDRESFILKSEFVMQERKG